MKKDMKNKKGFTLIELLAVIVILAIIALIATPIILGVIEDAKKGAFKDSAYGIIKSSENHFMSIQMSGNNFEDEVFDLTDNDLSYKGTKPNQGKIVIYKDGTMELEMNNGKFCARKNKGSSEVIVTEYVEGECDGSSISLEVIPTMASCFEFDSTTNTITKYKCYEENTQGLPTILDVVIPNEIDGVAVKAIGNWAFVGEYLNEYSYIDYTSWIKTVDFSLLTNLESIGIFAFFNSQLETVNLDGLINLKSIGDSAFCNSNNDFAGFIIGDGIKDLSLRGLINLESIGEKAFYQNKISTINFEGLTNLKTIGESAFANNELATIVNKTGSSFDWCSITEGTANGNGCTFVTGTLISPNPPITDQHIINIVAN